MKEFEVDDLAQYDGKDGKPAYVAYQGKVFDVSESKLWKGGIHMNRHPAGKELASDIQAAPHTPDVLERLPQVGTVKAGAVSGPQLPVAVSRIPDHFPGSFSRITGASSATSCKGSNKKREAWQGL